MPSEFDFEEGDLVLVKYRDGPTGRMQAKFVAECKSIDDVNKAAFTGRMARFEMPFGILNTVSIRPYEAEFEVVETVSEVNF